MSCAPPPPLPWLPPRAAPALFSEYALHPHFLLLRPSILPSRCRTNAIIAGFIVLECLKILSGRESACRYCVCNKRPSGRKRDLLLEGSVLDQPNPKCYVCGDSSLTLTLDTTTWTVGQLIDLVVKKHLSFNKPTIDATQISGDLDQLCEGDDDLDDEERAKYERYAALTLDKLPQPIVTGTKLEVEDFSQSLKVGLIVKHSVLDPDEVPAGFLVSGALPTAEADAPSAEPPVDSGSKRNRDDAVAAESNKKARADVDDDDDDCVILD